MSGRGCLVCGRGLGKKPPGSRDVLCRACRKSYDKGAFKLKLEGIFGAVEWALKRAVRFERLRAKKRASEDERERSL